MGRRRKEMRKREGDSVPPLLFYNAQQHIVLETRVFNWSRGARTKTKVIGLGS